jgi:hypothetical protein
MGIIKKSFFFQPQKGVKIRRVELFFRWKGRYLPKLYIILLFHCKNGFTYFIEFLCYYISAMANPLLFKLFNGALLKSLWKPRYFWGNKKPLIQQVSFSWIWPLTQFGLAITVHFLWKLWKTFLKYSLP